MGNDSMLQQWMNGTDNDSFLMVKAGDVKALISDLQNVSDSLMNENSQLQKQITLNQSRCLCYKGALEVIEKLIVSSDTIFKEEDNKVIEEASETEVPSAETTD